MNYMYISIEVMKINFIVCKEIFWSPPPPICLTLNHILKCQISKIFLMFSEMKVLTAKEKIKKKKTPIFGFLIFWLTGWSLIQKRAVHTKFYIYILLHILYNILTTQFLNREINWEPSSLESVKIMSFLNNSDFFLGSKYGTKLVFSLESLKVMSF